MSRKDFYHQVDAPQPNAIIPAASAVVINNKNQILMHKRSDNSLWSLLGGAMEIGETIEQTIIREVKEESGFNVKVDKCIGIYTDPEHVISYEDGEVRQQFSICFQCRILGGVKKVSSESIEVEFFTEDELEQLEMHPAQRIRLQDYFQKQERTLIR